MLFRYLFFLYLIFCYSHSFACLNESRVLLNGEVHISDAYSLVPSRYKSNVEYCKERLQEFDSLWKLNKNIKDYSDYGVFLVYLGRYEDAKKVFIEIEELSPNLYATAANLGTVYELLGQNKLALQWIKKL